MDPVSGGECIKTLIFCFKWSAASTVNAYISLRSFSQSFFIPGHFFMKLPTFLSLLFYLLCLDPLPRLCVFLIMMKGPPWTWSEDLKVLHKKNFTTRCHCFGMNVYAKHPLKT